MKLYDVIPILCPNVDLNNGFKNTVKTQYNYNIFMTDNRTAFDNRDATNAIRLKNCKQNIIVKGNTDSIVIEKRKETLSKISPMGGHTYEAGKSYFFFSKCCCLVNVPVDTRRRF